MEQTGPPISKITHVESMQQAIVYFVIFLASVTVTVVIVKWAYDPDVDLTKYASAILAPVLALTGPVLGFYFQTRNGNGNK